MARRVGQAKGDSTMIRPRQFSALGRTVFSSLVGLLLLSSLLVACGDAEVTLRLEPTASPVASVRAGLSPTPAPAIQTTNPAAPYPTPTPNPGAALTAQAFAQVQATANARSTVTARPQPITMRGTGDQLLSKIRLRPGVARLTLKYDGTSSFVVNMLDEAGNWVDNAANTISGPYQGSIFVRVPNTSTYTFQVQTAGNWEITIDDIDRLYTEQVAVGPYKGKGDAALSIRVEKTGQVDFALKHAGQSNFVVKFPDAQDGMVVALLVFIQGPFEGVKSVTLDKGVYFVNIRADGDWSMGIGYN